MTDALDYRPVLRAYPADCQPRAVEFLDNGGGLSGARLWKLATPRGTLLLRRWPREHPPLERLEFIQAVQWHVHQEGFHKVPLPLETAAHGGYVRHAGYLWELAPWLPGAADYRQAPSAARRCAGMQALAEFHQAVATFPLPDAGPSPSPGVLERAAQLQRLQAGELDQLRALVAQNADRFQQRAMRLLEMFPLAADRVSALLSQAAHVEVALAPCLRDIWCDNVLFLSDEVTGLIDFGSLRPENVAADVARLLGSMAEDSQRQWREGLAAYESVRPLAETEATLVRAFDASGVLLGGMNWLTWIYALQRTFTDSSAVEQRLDYFCRRHSSR